MELQVIFSSCWNFIFHAKKLLLLGIRQCAALTTEFIPEKIFLGGVQGVSGKFKVAGSSCRQEFVTEICLFVIQQTKKP